MGLVLVVWFEKVKETAKERTLATISMDMVRMASRSRVPMRMTRKRITMIAPLKMKTREYIVAQLLEPLRMIFMTTRKSQMC